MENSQLSGFGLVLLFILGALVLIITGFAVSRIFRPDNPNPEKLSSYECGEEPVGNAWGQFNIRFYIIALIFLVFEVEIIFLFPWATVSGRKEYIESTDGLWGIFAVAEVFIFVFILLLGLAYTWKKGFLDWIKPQQKITEYKSPVPDSLYQELNKKYSSYREGNG